MIQRFSTLLLCLILPLAAVASSDTIQFDDAWIKQLPPVVPVRAGYVTIRNSSDKPLRLVAVSGSDFDHVELHETRMVDGTMKMVQYDAFDIPAKGKLVLKPGGKHLMLFDPKRPLVAGDHTELSFSFDDGSQRNLNFEIRP